MSTRSAALVRTEIEQRLANRAPGAFVQRSRPELQVIRTGFDALDLAVGGIPIGALTEIVSPAGVTSGKTSLQMQLLAATTRKDFAALIDATDCFDPLAADAAGINLNRLLWV